MSIDRNYIFDFLIRGFGLQSARLENATHARTEVRATVKIGSIHFLTVDLGLNRRKTEG
jgi:hypothetical protein